MQLVPSRRTYFVDESGDGVLFTRRRQMDQSGGTLRFFILGLLDVADPAALTAELEELRVALTNDPYFKGVPSLKKTSIAFHAKDDLPEIRREVFKILLRQEVRFSAR